MRTVHLIYRRGGPIFAFLCLGLRTLSRVYIDDPSSDGWVAPDLPVQGRVKYSESLRRSCPTRTKRTNRERMERPKFEKPRGRTLEIRAFAYERVLAGVFKVVELARLRFFLTSDAVWSPWHGLKPFSADGLMTVNALPKCSLGDSREGIADQLELITALCALCEEHFFLVGRNRLVGDIVGFVSGYFATLLYSLQHDLGQVLLLVAQLLFHVAD